MNDGDKVEFANVMKATLDSYGRRPPLPETMRLWFELFRGVTIEAFRMACLGHIAESPRDPPTPAALLARMRERDGRPGPEEAWAIAVKACDESETVMMTDEVANAWGVARPIMDLGDEVGARMAFKEVYARLMESARGPVEWWPSIGSDPHKRDAALTVARASGLLPPPRKSTAELLEDQRAKQATPEQAAANLARIRAMMADMKSPTERMREAQEARAEEERERDAARKAAILKDVEQYKAIAKGVADLDGGN